MGNINNRDSETIGLHWVLEIKYNGYTHRVKHLYEGFQVNSVLDFLNVHG